MSPLIRNTSIAVVLTGAALSAHFAPQPDVDVWNIVATNEWPTFTIASSQVMRYGYGNSWYTKTLAAGTYPCSGTVFDGVDPAPGFYKECRVKKTGPKVMQTGEMPVVNVPLMQPARPAYNTARVQNSAGDFSGPYDIGAFRTSCHFSHFDFADPMVFPGGPGRSHLHLFFGNNGITAYSNSTSIATTGDSTCPGGTLNRTGYWTPAMIDLATGAPIVPTSANWYYKSAYNGVAAESVQPLPAGLRMIAGRSARKTPLDGSDHIRFTCENTGVYYYYLPNCDVGDILTTSISFPQCWDGVNLDSPNHQDHMSYANGSGCPTGTVPLVEISLNVHYTVTAANPGQNWKLSSDNYPTSGLNHGFSFHADWWNGWDQTILNEWTVNCINAKMSSQDSLCSGRSLY